MAKLYRINKGGGTKNDSKSVRFDLEEHSQNEKDEVEDIIGGVQERFPGFFEMPECCVPFEMAFIPADGQNVQFNGDIQHRGFPQPIELATTSASSSTIESKENEKGKSLFAQRFEIINQKNGPKQSDLREKENEGTKTKAISEIIKNLEIINATKRTINSTEPQRLAMDPVQMDLASKCLGNVLPRIEQQIVRLFDSLKCSNSKTNQIDILEEARTNLDSIRSLYLEQVENEESGRRIWVFAKGMVEPLADPAWMLIPIRRVLDAIQQRSSFCATPDDVEIVRLSLLWTVLLMRERNALFKGFTNPSGFYCRLAEIFLIGPEVFLYDEKITQCISIIIDEYLLEAGLKGQINILLNEPIAGLDAFMPFYADLLRSFEEFSSGDPNFSLILLIGGYLNNSRLDALLTLQALWSPQRNVVRQIRLPMDGRMELFLQHLKMQNNENMDEIFGEESQKSIEWQEYTKLMGHYENALKNGTVTTERNPMIFEIAEYEFRLPLMLNECLTYLKERTKEDTDFTYEVIVVDDGSSDATADIAFNFSQQYPIFVHKLPQNIGKGGAVREGVLCARGQFILFADADGATEFSDLEKLEQQMRTLCNGENSSPDEPADWTHPAIVVGSRAHLEKEAIAKRSLFRTILMIGFHTLVWIFTVRSIRDTQCGFKMFSRSAAAKLFTQMHIERWAFDVELIYLAEMQHFSLAEVAVEWTEIDGSKVTPIFSWLQMGRDILLIWYRYNFGIWKIGET